MILHRLHRFLRASLMALLVLGVIGTPVLRSVCEVHSIEHAWLAAFGPHAVHFEGDRDDPGDHGQSGEKHAHGAHGIWHQGGGPVFAPIASVVALTLIQPPRIALPRLDVSPIQPHASSSPFRPPIA